MILGISSMLFTQIHVAISLIAILAGFAVALIMIAGRDRPMVTGLFLFMTVLTSITGFFFPFHGMTPGIILGIASLVVLAVTLFAYYGKHLVGSWRRVYVWTAMIAQWMNCFVLIAQSFQKIPGLRALAPTGTETPFKLAQAGLLVLMVLLTIGASRRFGKVTAV